MPRGILLSAAGHLVVLALLAFGLPRWGDEPIEYRPLPVEIVEIDDLVRSPAPAPKPEEKPEPPKPEPVKETPPPPPPPQPEIAKAEPVPEPVPEPEEVAPAPEPEQAEPEPEPEPEPAPEPEPQQLAAVPAPVAKPKPPVKKQDNFASLLKTVEDLKDQPREQPEEKQEATVQPEREVPPSQVPLGEQLTASEEDLVRQQIIQCWRVPAGARDAADLAVVVRVYMNRDGTVRSAELVDRAAATADPFRRAAAESALRAALNPRCQPFKLPPEKYDTWQVFTFRFDPQDLIY